MRLDRKTTVPDIVAVGGLIFCQTTGRCLFLLRDQDTYSGCWGLMGGRQEPGENIMQCLNRECREETGHRIVFDQIIPVDLYQSADEHFCYHTFLCMVQREFVPELSTEHSGYAWCPVDRPPRPLHPGLYNSLNARILKDKLDSLRYVLGI
jgi:8-oxo-dGTP pyrophosphatase MutT (NUDIX family)